MWLLFALEVIFLIFIVTIILNLYVSFKNLPWYVYCSSWLGWLISFAVVILVPLDILATDFELCIGPDGSSDTECQEPVALLSFDHRVILWRVLYWTSFMLTWFVYPFLQRYVESGHFKRADRLREAFEKNIVFYAIVFVLGLIGIFYLVAVKDFSWSSIIGIAMAASNAWGIFILVALMGYGLVEIPRTMWRKANRSLMLRYVKYQITSLEHGKAEAREYLTTTLKQIRKVADKMSSQNPMRGYLEIVVRQCPAAEYSEIKKQSDKSGEITFGKLVNLNVQIKKAKHNLRHAEALYSETLKTAFDIEDVLMAMKYPHKRAIIWSFIPPRTGRFATQLDFLEWVWYTYLDTKALLLMCFACMLLSCVIVWEEMTLAIPDLSVFSLLVDKHIHVLLSQAVVFIPLAYSAFAAYSTLFRIRLFNYYRLIPQQETDSKSIMFSAGYLCGLCTPLSYNFIMFLHMKETAFEKVMGSMKVVSFLGKYFYLYFPVLIVVVCVANLLNLTSRILLCLRIKRFQFDENFNDSQIDEGGVILHNERARGAIALKTRTLSPEPVELLSLSVPVSAVPEPPKSPPPSKYGYSERFSRDDLDDEITADPIVPQEDKKLLGGGGFPSMHRIFGKGRIQN